MTNNSTTSITLSVILFVVLMIEIIMLVQANTGVEPQVSTTNEMPSLPVVSPMPTETPYPIPSPTSSASRHEIITKKAIEATGYVPTLRTYDIDKSDELWHPYNPSSYITPYNAWVQFYAKSGETPQTIFETDEALYPKDPNNDVWQTAEYTLYSGYGDCEDITIVQVSIFIARGYKAMAVGGIIEDDTGEKVRDFWFEYYDSTTSTKYTRLTTASALNKAYKMTPLYMFNDKTQWSTYDENWYIN